MDDLKLEACKTCGGIPAVVTYNSGQKLIRCKCGMQTSTKLTVRAAADIWNGYHEPSLKEVMVDLLSEIRSLNQRNAGPSVNK